jgi:hypothetical protein
MTEAAFTIEQFTAALEAAVAERGKDYIYPRGNRDYTTESGTCVYSTPGGEPACLIGLALHKIDPSLVPEYGIVSGATDVLRALVDADDPESEEFNLFLNAADNAQGAQDMAKTWGKALTTYKATLAGEEPL